MPPKPTAPRRPKCRWSPIVVGGLGVGAAKTTDAIMKLPPAVTLAFTPYGSDPAKLAERARAQRHEILLQIPMEPFDYPDNDPGPQTLLTTLGARAESRPAVLAPQPLPGLCRHRQFHGRALRRDRRRDAADHPRGRQARARLSRRRLGAAQRRARSGGGPGDAVRQGRFHHRRGADRGGDRPGAAPSSKPWPRSAELAVGVASALPISIERIGVWIKALESRGIMLVPLTTAMLKSKSG